MLLTTARRTAHGLHRFVGPRGLGVGRTAVGVAMLTRPTLLPTSMGVDVATAQRMAWSTQMLGAREVSLGLGAVITRGRGPAGRLWLVGGLLADAVDAVAVSRAVGSGQLARREGSAAVAVAALAVAVQARALAQR